MPARGPPSPTTQPAKRQRQSSFDDGSPRNGQTSPNDHHPDGTSSAAPSIAASKAGQSSNFRNVSACNRCRLRKNRCDQKLPSCASCAKAGVACVGYDPITKKEIPRRYEQETRRRAEHCARCSSGASAAIRRELSMQVLIRGAVMSSISKPELSSSRTCYPPTTSLFHPPRISKYALAQEPTPLV